MHSRLPLLLAACSAALLAQKKPVTLEVAAQSRPEADSARGLNWMPDGRHFAYFQGKRLMLYDVPAKSERELMRLEPLESAAAKVPAADRFDWQNRRVRANSIEWSASGKEILLSVEGDL